VVANVIDPQDIASLYPVTGNLLEWMREQERARGAGGSRNAGRRAVRDDIAKGVRVLIPARPSARHAQPAPFVEPERNREALYVEYVMVGVDSSTGRTLSQRYRVGPLKEKSEAQALAEISNGEVVIGESQREHAIRCAFERVKFDRARRTAHEKGSSWGGNSWRANALTRVPYPPTDELEEQLAKIRRAQRNERKRGRVPGVVARPHGAGAGWKPDGKILEERRAAYETRLELKRMGRRVKRHGGPFSKRSRELDALYGKGGVK
jgi:hypothetical protein